jgi:hypothetical protein
MSGKVSFKTCAEHCCCYCCTGFPQQSWADPTGSSSMLRAMRRRSRATEQPSSGQESLQAADAAPQHSKQQQPQQQQQQQQQQQKGRSKAVQGAWKHMPTQAQLLAAGRLDLLYSLRQYGYEDVLQELVARGWQLSSPYKQPRHKASFGFAHPSLIWPPGTRKLGP